MTIGNVGLAGLLPLPSLTSGPAQPKVGSASPTATGSAPAAALEKGADGDKGNSGIGKQVDALA